MSMVMVLNNLFIFVYFSLTFKIYTIFPHPIIGRFKRILTQKILSLFFLVSRLYEIHQNYYSLTNFLNLTRPKYIILYNNVTYKLISCLINHVEHNRYNFKKLILINKNDVVIDNNYFLQQNLLFEFENFKTLEKFKENLVVKTDLIKSSELGRGGIWFLGQLFLSEI